ncbi:MAG: hypothetical protein HY263_11265 [Chloroflexi bacterium]|nr:hypothetical protein [Chloroflexota bacterium]
MTAQTPPEPSARPTRSRRSPAENRATTFKATDGPPDGASRPGRAHAATPPAVAADGSAIEADRVEIRQAALGRADAREVEVIQGAIGGVRADHVSVRQGIVGGSVTGSLEVNQGIARTVFANRATVSQSFARTVIANEVQVTKATGIGLLIARHVEGDVKVLLDWRGAAIMGAVGGLVAGLVRTARRGRRRA